MSLEELVQDFLFCKKNEPSDVNELLDFIQLRYLQGEFTLQDYCHLLRALHDRGAQKPDYFMNDHQVKILTS